MGPSENPKGCWGDRGDILQRPVRVCGPGSALRGQRQLFPLRSQVPAVFQWDLGDLAYGPPRRRPPPPSRESGSGRDSLHKFRTQRSGDGLCRHASGNPCVVRTGSRWFGLQSPESANHRIRVHLSRNLRRPSPAPSFHIRGWRRTAACPRSRLFSRAPGARHVTEMQGHPRGYDGWGSRPVAPAM